jgi:hypothetical protein
LKDSEGDRQPVADHDRQHIATHDRQGVATHRGVTGKNLQSDRQKSAEVTGKPLPTNPLKEPLEEPIEKIDSAQLDLGEDLGRRSPDPTDIDADFEKWYSEYPRHVAKAAAFRAYRAAVITKKQATPEVMLAGAMRYAAETEDRNPMYIKHPATWIRGGCWADEPVGRVAPAASGYGHHLDQALADARLIAERAGQ